MLRVRTQTLRLTLREEGLFWSWYVAPDALSKGPDSSSFRYDEHQIESSTDVRRVKSGHNVSDTNCVMVSELETRAVPSVIIFYYVQLEIASYEF